MKERLSSLFARYEKDVRRVIDEVVSVEQQYISMERPRVKEKIKEIIDRIVKDEA